METWIETLAEEKLGKSTQRAAQTTIKACWNWAASDHSGPLPPDFRPFAGMSKIKIPPKPLTEDALLTEEEVELLFKHADDDLGRIRGENGRYRQRKRKEFRIGDQNPYREFEDILKTYYHRCCSRRLIWHILKSLRLPVAIESRPERAVMTGELLQSIVHSDDFFTRFSDEPSAISH